MLRRVDDGWQVGEIARARVPPLVRQVIEGRLARLDGECRRLLAVAAVIGQEVPLTLWGEVAGIAEGALLPTVERATAARLMEESPGGVGMRFSHALIRETLYDSTPLPKRREYHLRAAEILLTREHPNPDTVANHLRRAGDPRATTWLVNAGERAYRAYAFLTAAERFIAALRTMDEGQQTDLRDRGWVLYRLSDVERFADPWRGVEYLTEAITCAAAVGDEVLRARALLSRSNKYTLTGDLRRAFADYEAHVVASDRLPEGAPPGIGMAGDGKVPGGSGPAFYHALAGSYGVALERVERVVGVALDSDACRRLRRRRHGRAHRRDHPRRTRQRPGGALRPPIGPPIHSAPPGNGIPPSWAVSTSCTTSSCRI